MVITAGGEITARSLAFAMYHMHANPQVLHRLVEEFTMVMPNRSVQPSIKTLQKLPYLVSSRQVPSHTDPVLTHFKICRY